MKIPSRARKTSKLSALFKKVSIADLPYEALDIVFGNINQHQALALASLHSKLQYLMKKSFIKTYIYIGSAVEQIQGKDAISDTPET